MALNPLKKEHFSLGLLRAFGWVNFIIPFVSVALIPSSSSSIFPMTLIIVAVLTAVTISILAETMWGKFFPHVSKKEGLTYTGPYRLLSLLSLCFGVLVLLAKILVP